MKRLTLLTVVVAVTLMACPAWGQCVRACLDGDNLTYQIIDAEGEPFTRARIEENDYGWIFFYVFPDSGWEFVVGGITAESDLMAEDGSITINFNTNYEGVFPEFGLEGVFPDDVDWETMIFGAGLEGGDGDPDPANVQVMSFEYTQGDLNFGEMLDFGAFGTDCNDPPYCEAAAPEVSAVITGPHNVDVGADVTLTVVTDGIDSPTYLWDDASTASTLALGVVDAGDTGVYTCTVGGDAGGEAIDPIEASFTLWVGVATPLAGGLGLGLLAGACALAGAVSIRRKK